MHVRNAVKHLHVTARAKCAARVVVGAAFMPPLQIHIPLTRMSIHMSRAPVPNVTVMATAAGTRIVATIIQTAEG